MDSPTTLAYCLFALFVGGFVKGVVGLGLPLVGVPLLMVALKLKTAIGVLVVPLIASNLAQMFQGGLFRVTVRRFWPVAATLLVSVALATQLLVVIPERVLYAIIGVAVIVVPLVAHLRPSLGFSARQERWIGPLAGLLSGVIGGISTFYGPPLMLYIVWLRLPKEIFVVAVSLLFFVGAVGLAIGLAAFGVTSASDLAVSLAATIPVFIGLWVGQKLRFGLTEKRFKLLVLVVYVATGGSFLVRLL